MGPTKNIEYLPTLFGCVWTDKNHIGRIIMQFVKHSLIYNLKKTSMIYYVVLLEYDIAKSMLQI